MACTIDPCPGLYRWINSWLARQCSALWCSTTYSVQLGVVNKWIQMLSWVRKRPSRKVWPLWWLLTASCVVHYASYVIGCCGVACAVGCRAQRLGHALSYHVPNSFSYPANPCWQERMRVRHMYACILHVHVYYV